VTTAIYVGKRDCGNLAGSVFKGGTGLGKTSVLDFAGGAPIDAQKMDFDYSTLGFAGKHWRGSWLRKPPPSAAPPPSDCERVEVLGTGEGRAISQPSGEPVFDVLRTASVRTTLFWVMELMILPNGKAKGIAHRTLYGLFELYDAVCTKVTARASTPF